MWVGLALCGIRLLHNPDLLLGQLMQLVHEAVGGIDVALKHGLASTAISSRFSCGKHSAVMQGFLLCGNTESLPARLGPPKGAHQVF